MKRLRADISHRIRRRPSVFAATWIRVLLLGGVGVAGGLLAGPPLLAWLVGGPTRPASRPTPPGVAARGPAAPSQAEPGAGAAALSQAGPGAGPAPSAPPVPAPAPSRAAAGPRMARAGTYLPAEAPPPPPEGLRAPAGERVYRVQLGVFREPRNAAQLVARLRSAGFGDITVTEEERVRYRVVVPAASVTEAHDEELDQAGLQERLRALGLDPSPVSDGYAVTGPVPRGTADEVAERLRGEGLKGLVTEDAAGRVLRIVRVGSYRSMDEAERVRVDLAGRGFPAGAVVREQ